jgi:hypothetical protein
LRAEAVFLAAIRKFSVGGTPVVGGARRLSVSPLTLAVIDPSG